MITRNIGKFETEEYARELTDTVLTPRKLRDAPCTDNGFSQAKDQQSLLNKIDLNPTVLCSPHIRTI